MRVLLFAAAVAALACSGTEPFELETLMWVGPDSVSCVGAHGPQKCLSVRELVGGDVLGNYHPFYWHIEGFSHEPGFEYQLLVGQRTIRNPPADGSSIAYRLISVVSKTAVSQAAH
jgi:hypothetical protein